MPLTQPGGGVVAPALGLQTFFRVMTASFIGTLVASAAGVAGVPAAEGGGELCVVAGDAAGTAGGWFELGFWP